MEVSDWSHTREALEVLKESLCCSLCSGLLKEPCTLGSCGDLFCRGCIGDHIGNACPVCHAQAWANELQMKREIANIIKLYHKMCRLVDDPNNVPTETEENSHDDENEMVDSVNGSHTSGSSGANQSLESLVNDSQQRHRVKKVVKTVVGKHGKLSCIVKHVEDDDASQSQKIVNSKPVKTSSSNNLSIKHFEVSSTSSSESISDSGSVEEADSMNVYDFIASPARPKPAKKRKAKQVDPKVLRARRVAAANKKWSKTSKFTKASKKQKKKKTIRHVSFREDTDSDTRHCVENSQEGIDTGSESMWDDVEIVDMEISQTNSTGSVSFQGEQNEISSSIQKPSDRKNKPKVTPKKSRRKSDSDVQKTPARLEEDIKSSLAGNKKRRNSVGKTPVRTSPSGKENVRSKGVSPGKSVIKRNIRGETPLHLAAIKGDATTLQELLKDGTDPNVKDHAGWMPLHEACNHGHAASVIILLDHGALINAPGFEHDSPLHDAVTNNRVEVVKLLVERGASLKSRNMHGLTPVDCAKTDDLKAALNTKPLVTSSPMTALKSPKAPPVTNQPLVVLSTGLNKSQRTKLESCVRLLKGRIIADFHPDVTHLIAACPSDRVCLRTIKYLQAILAGKWVLSYEWVIECLKKKQRLAEDEFEVLGTTLHPKSYGPRKGRDNSLNQFPGLFDGCNFFFYGTYKPNPSKTQLIELVKCGGGSIVQRQPKPHDDVIQTSTAVPYHVSEGSQLANCSYFIIYDQTTTKVPPKVNTGKVCTASLSWLMSCICKFSLLDLD